MEIVNLFSKAMLILAFLVILTNVIVQVLKGATWDKIPTNLLALIVALFLTIAIGIALLQIYGIAVTWWMIAGLIVLGVIVAYGAMFGFDKFRELAEQWLRLLQNKL